MQQSVAEGALSNIYSSYRVALGDSKERMQDWLDRYSIELSGSSRYDYERLSESIFTVVTGSSQYSEISKAEIHSAMLSIVTRLSGYNLQIIQIPPQDTTFSLSRRSLKYAYPRIQSEINRLYFKQGVNFTFGGIKTKPFKGNKLKYQIGSLFREKTIIRNLSTHLRLGKLPIEVNYKATIRSSIGNMSLPLHPISGKVEILSKPKTVVSLTLGEVETTLNKPNKLTASVVYSNNSKDDYVIWSVDSTERATISKDGLLTPKCSGKIHVTAKSKLDPSVKKTVEFNIVLNTN